MDTSTLNLADIVDGIEFLVNVSVDIGAKLYPVLIGAALFSAVSR